ncbi:HEAT repeat domain-containing protein [Actinotalea sp. K2]|uniref:HEAT repeat domain-containing protein n=1 Tax=Actinotalea sp. K2 TaxID=2939438 RepID=UPI002017E021|nr:HEAT repeat domain-containing protein [Actinotalea sp. K2]MCL3862516.1 HEAT repeat domain-containing protein [Actinotalea sp. K2]
MLTATLIVLGCLTVVLAGLVTLTTAGRALRERASRRVADRRTHLRAQAVVALGLRRGDTTAATAALRAAARGRHRQEVLDIFTSIATTLGAEHRETVTDLSTALELTDHLLAGLHHSEPARRVAAVEIIGLLGGADHTPALHQAMRDGDQRVRVAAARAYLVTAPATAATAIVRMLTHEEPHVAGELAEVLRSHHGPQVGQAVTRAWTRGTRSPLLVSLVTHTVDPSTALGMLVDATRSPDPALRRAGVSAMAGIPTELTLTALADVTGDPDPGVRALAATALGVMAGPTTIPLLIAALDDASWAVRHRAAAALASIPDGTVILTSLLGQATPFVTTAVTTALHEHVATGGLLSALVDPVHTDRARRAVRVLADRPEMVPVLHAAAVRHPDPAVRAALSGLVPALPAPTDPSVVELVGAR